MVDLSNVSIINRLFVYRILAPGRCNEHVLARLSGTCEPATVKGTLFPEGWGAAAGYSGIVLDEQGDTVHGLIFNSGKLPAHWEKLDVFEGDGHERVITSAKRDNCTVIQAYVYELKRDGESSS